MPKRTIAILEHKGSDWPRFFTEFFEDTPTEIQFFSDPDKISTLVDAGKVDLLFINPQIVSHPLIPKLQFLRNQNPELRIFGIETHANKIGSLTLDHSFEKIIPLADFQKHLVRRLALPEKLRVLVVDDEPEIPAMIADFLEDRIRPSFELETAPDGRKGLDKILKNKPDVLVMDVKMPEMDGRELYREIRKRKIDLPVIVFFNPISGEEILEIRQYGNPAVVDKASRTAALPFLKSLIMKMAYFA